MRKRLLRVTSVAICAMMLCSSVLTADSDGFDANNHRYFTNQGTPNFETDNLTLLTNTVGDTTYNWYNRVVYGGCMVTCCAMILDNLGATTTEAVFDVRDGDCVVRDADPVTVMYANTNFATITSNGTNFISSYNGDPVYIYSSRIANNFDKECHVVDLSGCSNAEKLYNITYYRNLNPEGVIAYFFRTEYNQTLGKYENHSHGVVVMESSASLDYGRSFTGPIVGDRICTEADVIAPTEVPVSEINSRATGFNSESTIYAQHLTVCDTVNYNSYPGDYVNMCDAYIGVASDFQFEHITKIYYFD